MSSTCKRNCPGKVNDNKWLCHGILCNCGGNYVVCTASLNKRGYDVSYTAEHTAKAKELVKEHAGEVKYGATCNT